MFAEERIEKEKYFVYSASISKNSVCFFIFHFLYTQYTHVYLRQECPDPDAVVNPVAEESFEDVPLAVNFSCVYFVE